ncbi:MAG: tRNA 2-thiouridine(34) synthase MnmA [Ruminococcaceae bacterium]|nr:tRNA 2-thiouridine(34) synthase MnmA [Oscillospiraceae bacterium]
MKVLLGLSGGVDSQVAARLLLEQGHEVIGLYLDNGFPGAERAEKAAAELGILFYTRDIREALEEHVCAPFAAGYLRGETPSPCVLCNRAVKFAALLTAADELGAEAIATGHYARSEDGRLYKGRTPNDQSYMLCRLKREQAAQLLLPLGPYEKKEVRAMAAQWGLSSAESADSMEICFIPDGDYAAYIERRGQTPPPGPYIYKDKVVGQHRGIHHFTIGQRRRLGIALGRRIYVSAIRPEDNAVVLSDGDEVYTDCIRVGSLSWLEDVVFPLHCTARIRHSRSDTPPARLDADGTLHFAEAVRAPTPGQAVAFYDGDRLLGGGFIEKS